MVELQRIGQTEVSSAVLLAIHYAGLLIRHESAAGALTQLVNALGTPSLQPLAVQYLLDVSPLAASDLTKSLANPDPEIRRLVAEVLGFSGNAAVVASLEPLTKDRDPDIAQAATRAIQRLRMPLPAKTPSRN
jgi:HEAT repeat protein